MTEIAVHLPVPCREPCCATGSVNNLLMHLLQLGCVMEGHAASASRKQTWSIPAYALLRAFSPSALYNESRANLHEAGVHICMHVAE